METLLQINNKYNITSKYYNNIKSIYKKYQGGDKYSEKLYHLIYEDIFSKYRNKNINFLEIGILEGYSLAIHSDYFPNGKLYGYDIDIEPFNKNLKYLKSIGCFKNNNIIDIKKVNSIEMKDSELNDKFDIIIDDGDHNPYSQIRTFENFFHTINEDGIYIIEDVTDFRLECLKFYLDYLNVEYEFHRYHKTNGSILIKYQPINFSNKEEPLKELLKNNDVFRKEYNWIINQYNK